MDSMVSGRKKHLDEKQAEEKRRKMKSKQDSILKGLISTFY